MDGLDAESNILCVSISSVIKYPLESEELR